MDTKQQLDSVQRYKAGYYSDEWGVRGSTPTCIPAHDGAWVRFADMQALQAGYDAAQLEIESLKARVQELGQLESALARHERSGKDWAMRVEVLERNIVMLRAQIASHAAQVAAGKKAMRELESANSIALQACARVKELEAQPDAIGAVEPLRKTDTAARGTDAQIIKERKLCAYAFAGAVADGLSGGTGPDSQESEWLRPAFEAGQEIAQLRAEIDQLRKRQCLHQISEPDHLRGATKKILLRHHHVVTPGTPLIPAHFRHPPARQTPQKIAWPGSPDAVPTPAAHPGVRPHAPGRGAPPEPLGDAPTRPLGSPCPAWRKYPPWPAQESPSPAIFLLLGLVTAGEPRGVHSALLPEAQPCSDDPRRCANAPNDDCLPHVASRLLSDA